MTAGVTVSTNNDKTGYSLTQGFPANFAALGITVGGKISEVGARRLAHDLHGQHAANR